MSFRDEMTHIASADDTVCRVCVTFPCECPSADQYDEDVSDMEIPANVVRPAIADDRRYLDHWYERFAS